MNTTLTTLALNLALNSRGIYNVTVIDTIENGNGLDVEFKRPNQYYKGGASHPGFLGRI